MLLFLRVVHHVVFEKISRKIIITQVRLKTPFSTFPARSKEKPTEIFRWGMFVNKKKSRHTETTERIGEKIAQNPLLILE